MKIYVPLVYFEVDGEDKEICDVILNGYYNKGDASMIYPNAEIIEIEVDPVNPQAN